MPTCTFCRENYSEHKGLTVFTFDGRAVNFCSSKCRRNMTLKRDSKKVNWIKREKKKKGGGKVVEKKVEKKASEKAAEKK